VADMPSGPSMRVKKKKKKDKNNLDTVRVRYKQKDIKTTFYNRELELLEISLHKPQIKTLTKRGRSILNNEFN
jgi:hypothetical protein